MEETAKKPKRKACKVIKVILLVLLALIVLCVATVAIVWHNEIGTILSLEQLSPRDEAHQDGAVYSLEVKGGYYFDDFLAQGGCATDSELVDFVVNHITRGLLKLEINPGQTGCASFTATTADGDRVFGRNYDMKETGTCIVYTNPGDGRHASYSTIDDRFISVGVNGPDSLYQKVLCLAAAYVPMDGMNDAGVSAGIYMSYQDGSTNQETDKPDITSSAMVRLILDYADDVDEAIDLVLQYDLHDSAGFAYHYMVADAEGNSAVLEWVNGGYNEDKDCGARTLKVTYCDEKGYQAVTNYVIAEGYYDSIVDKSVIHGKDRYDYIMEKLDETKGVIADEEAAMQLLNDVSRRDWTNEQGLTIHSVVYNLTDKTVYWVGNEHYGEDGYVFHFSFDR